MQKGTRTTRCEHWKFDYSDTKTNPTVSSYQVHFVTCMKCLQKCQKIAVLSERRLWFPTSDHLQTWLILSGTAQSRQYHESTMVWPNLPPRHRFLYLVLLFSTKTAWQRGSKHYLRFYEGNLRQTMVDSWYCLDRVGAEGRSQVSRQSEVGKHKRRSVFRWALRSNEYFMHFLALCL